MYLEQLLGTRCTRGQYSATEEAEFVLDFEGCVVRMVEGPLCGVKEVGDEMTEKILYVKA